MKAAIYARYSTDKQTPESLDDQFYQCERIATREGFEVVSRFSDAEKSAGTHQRPGYQNMLTEARAGRFNVIITEDISRLWRNRAEFGPRSAELEDLGIHWVSCVGQDTRRDGWGLVIQILQAMAEHARREASYRTRRGLEGLARAGKPTGRSVYGYTPASQSTNKKFEIKPVEAAVIVRIFTLYVDGYSPRAIANILNTEGVPSPRAKSKTAKKHRMLGWRGSVIKGTTKRGSGILNNALYRGEVIWGRSRWVRSAADSSNRSVKQVPEKEWNRHTDASLRIISQELWELAEERKASVWKRAGERVSKGMSKDFARRTGAGPKFLFSGLLHCSQCGSNYIICGRDMYGCAGNLNGGSTMCPNNARVRRHALEREALRGIKAQLSAPEAIEEICRQVRMLLKKPRAPAPNYSVQIGELRAQINNLAEAIATGLMRASSALGARLSEAEDELERLEQSQKENEASARSPERLLTDLTDRVTQAVGALEETLATGDIAKSRREIEDKVGRIQVEADQQEIRLYSDKMHLVSRFMRATGTHASLCGSGGLLPHIIVAENKCGSGSPVRHLIATLSRCPQFHERGAYFAQKREKKQPASPAPAGHGALRSLPDRPASLTGSLPPSIAGESFRGQSSPRPFHREPRKRLVGRSRDRA